MKSQRRVFYVLYFKDPVRPYIDALRLIADPGTKTPAHVTVRGPYKKHIKADGIEHRAPKVLHINGSDTFFEEGQNTVFLRCSAPELKQIWRKPSYPFNPHITLYDGKSRLFAEKLKNLLSKYDLELCTEVSNMRPLVTKGQTDLRDYYEIDSRLLNNLRKVLGKSVNISEINEDDRIHLAKCILDEFSRLQVNESFDEKVKTSGFLGRPCTEQPDAREESVPSLP